MAKETLYPHVTGKQLTALPIFKGYTVDDRLREFRKGQLGKGMQFISFDSPQGQSLYAEYTQTQSKYPRMLPTTRTSEEFIPARDRPYKSPPGRLEPQRTIKTQGGFNLKNVYQRGPDGYPVNADKLMRDAWGKIPNPNQQFSSDMGYTKPDKIYGWSWSETFHRWSAFVRFPNGKEIWSYPRDSQYY
jgi:hypothetical protein